MTDFEDTMILVSSEKSAAALAESFYAKIENDDPKIGAFLTLSKERAMAKASEMDALAAKGEKLPPLGGVPVSRLLPNAKGVDDLILVAATEVNTDEDRAAYVTALKEVV